MKHVYNSKQIQLIYKGYKIISKIKTSIQREIYEVPYISCGYWNPKPRDTDDVIIPLYITDFYQSEYYYGNTSLKFKLRVEVDGIVTWKENLKAGDYELNLGKFEAGMHWFSLQVVDQYGEESGRITNELWVINQTEYEIKDEEIYTITNDDLLANNITINLNDTATAEQMKNNRCGLTNLFANLQQQGYRKCILPNGIYRVNYSQYMAKGNDSPIMIPTNFTVDMNGGTFKLHPYDDREYGDRGSVFGLMVKMEDCFDSHLINGTLEGDYAERQEMTWEDGTNAIASSNGEHNGIFAFFGAKYCSLDNVIIKQVTGYNVCIYQNGNHNKDYISLGTIVDNIKLVEGIEVEDENYCTSSMSSLADATSGYIVCSVWLTMGGLNTQHWDIDMNFYDKNQEFIEKIRVNQFRRCKIPEGAKYVRTTFKGDSSEVYNRTYHHMNVSKYCEIKNCDWIDNRTCCAPFQFQHLHMYNCTFTRSGQSITPSAIDLEDGWEQMQDFYLRYCNILERSGTEDLIDCAGINHNIEHCDGLRVDFRYRIHGIEFHNNTNCKVDISTGWMTKNSIRIYENDMIEIGNTGNYNNNGYLDNLCKYCFKNNKIRGAIIDLNDEWMVQNCDIELGNTQNCIIKDSIVKIYASTCYINKDVEFYNCTFETYGGLTQSDFAFNAHDVYRLYKDCIFNTPSSFNNKFYFNSGIFENCTFNETLTISNATATKVVGELAFINCTFNKQVTINSDKNSQVEFINCTFAEPIKYSTPTAQNLCVFSNEINPNLTYVEISNPIEYFTFGEISQSTSFALPFYATNKKLTWSINNNLALIDENGNVTAGNEVGEFIIKCQTDGEPYAELSRQIVNVDYEKGKLYESGGGYSNYAYGGVDNIYKEVIGGATISVISPNIGYKRVSIVEYDNNKNYLAWQTGTTNPKSFTLNENTAYIRVSFVVNNSEKGYTQLFYEYIIETVTNK